MKNILTQLALLVCAILTLTACPGPVDPPQTQTDGRPDNKPDAELDTTTQLVLKYCSDNIIGTGAVGQDDPDRIYEQHAAIRLTSDVLLGLHGNRIIKMGAAISRDVNNYSDLVFWVREDLDSENIWECAYTGEIQLLKWNEMVVSPYFKIQKDKEYYIGYTIKADKAPIIGDNSVEQNPDAAYIYDHSSKSWISYPALGNLYIRATVSGEWMQNDVEATIGAPKYLKPGEAFDAVVYLRGKIGSDVQSFDLVAKAGGQELLRKTVTFDTPLKLGTATTVFVHDLTINRSGVNDITYTIDKINGLADSSPENSTVVIRTDVSDAMQSRLVLLENFTGASCPNCPTGHDNIHKAIEEIGEQYFTMVAHHSGYYADNFTTHQDDSCKIFYGSNSTYAPAVMIDRTPLGIYGAIGAGAPAPGPAFDVNGNAITGDLVKYMRYMTTQKSPVSMTETHEYNAESRLLTVNIEGTILSDLVDADALGVGVMLVEDSISGRQSGAQGTYTFMDVAREGPTSVFAEAVSADGKDFRYTVSTVLASKYKPENMQVVTWAANKQQPFNWTEQYNNCIVYQTTVNDVMTK